MKQADYKRFTTCLTAVAELYSKEVSQGAMLMWWKALARFEIEQVEKAFDAAIQRADGGQFMPKPADLIKAMEGTQTDRSLIAWGKVLDAIQRVGAYKSVVFDDGIIHAVIEDLGGWMAVCRGNIDELPFLQSRFAKSYQAYAGRPDVRYPAKLLGEHEQSNRLHGYPAQPPILIGDPTVASTVMLEGSNAPKTQITSATDVPGLLKIGSDK